MNTSEHVRERVRKALEQVFDELPENITDHTNASDVPAWDSLAHINVVLALEREFGVKFTSIEVQEMQNIGHIVELIKLK